MKKFKLKLVEVTQKEEAVVAKFIMSNDLGRCFVWGFYAPGATPPEQLTVSADAIIVNNGYRHLDPTKA